MARVQSVGASVSLNEWAPPPSPDAPPQERTVNLNIRLFVDLDDHRRLIDPNPQSSGLSLPEVSTTITAVREAIGGLLAVSPALPMEHRASIWHGVVAELEKEGIGIDPETLHTLPFRLEYGDDVIEQLPQ